MTQLERDRQDLIHLYNIRLQSLHSAKKKTEDKTELHLIDIQIALITNFILALESLGGGSALKL